jgi:hypothetical protein
MPDAPLTSSSPTTASRQTRQLKLSTASLDVRRQLAESQRDAALESVADLEAQLEAIGADIAAHMQVGGRGRTGAVACRVLWLNPWLALRLPLDCPWPRVVVAGG